MSSNAPPPEQTRERVKHLLEEDLAQSGMYPDELVTVLLAMAADRPMHPIAPPPMRVTDYATAAYRIQAYHTERLGVLTNSGRLQVQRTQAAVAGARTPGRRNVWSHGPRGVQRRPR